MVTDRAGTDDGPLPKHRTDGHPSVAGPDTSLTVAGPHGPVGVHVWRSPGASPAAPVVLAFHGWTDGGLTFDTLFHDLGGRWTVVAVDAPAHGLTPWPAAASYTVESATPGALAVVDALPEILGTATPPLVLVGHSLGGLTAAHVAAARPALVRRLVLEEPIKISHRASRMLSRWRAGTDAKRWLAWMRNMQALDHEGRLAWVANRNDKWRPIEYPSWARTKAQVDLAHLAVPVDWGRPLLEIVPAVSAPVTVVLGGYLRGGVSSRGEIAALEKACPGGCHVARLDAGHNPRRDAPEAFAALLDGLLSSS